MIYLDNAATTKIDSNVLEKMLPYLKDNYGNAGSLYELGRKSAAAIQTARSQVASLINAKAEQIVFTSGGSESNNMVIKGVARRLINSGKYVIITSNIEHDSIINATNSISDEFYIRRVPVNPDGAVKLKALSEMLTPQVGLVSIMFVNNEIGSINPVKEIAKMCREHGILFHTDCVQAVGTIPVDVEDIGCDFASISSHKIHGPKGIGALYIRDKSSIAPLICGGANQEFGFRGGTENVAGIVGFGEACALVKRRLETDAAIIQRNSEIFYKTLTDILTKKYGESMVKLNCEKHIGKILNIQVKDIDADSLILLLDAGEVCVSAGSACRSHESLASRVLLAVGLSPDEARNSVRVSFSSDISEDEARDAAAIMADCISLLREHSWEDNNDD